MTDSRIPPQALEAEQSTLGAMMLSQEAIEEAAAILQPADFYSPQNRAIFETIVSMTCRSQPVDSVTLRAELTAIKKLEVAGGLPYLGSLLHIVPTSANCRRYAEIVAQKSILRRLADVGAKLYNQAFAPDADPAQLLETADEALMALHGAKRPGEGFESLEAGLPREAAALNAASDKGTDLLGVRSGYGELDLMTGGWQKGDLIILGARPSVGKSTMAIDLVMTAAEFQTGAVAMFSLEMSRSQIYRRLLSSGRGSFGQEVDGHRMRTPALLTDEDWSKLAGTVNRLYQMPVWLDDSSSMTVAEMRSACRRLKARHGLSFVAVDYLQLITSSLSTGNANTDLTAVSKALKQMARELDVPVLVLSQLSRGVEQRADKRPVLSDLRDCGALEADADTAMFLYRDGYYNRKKDDLVPELDPTELIVRKQRNGPTGTVALLFDARHQTFRNVDRDRTDAP